ncbi:MAG: ABC transporter permease [Bacteroidales bacterium]|jgi:phospholipid/cholesterol/gamma-HCH transport system permease protein|nr:ABC transporter permease [Bacteroidales bacterium]MBO7648856.1 ABC transporter permease [Bacteroidales bacterium]MCR4858453.1 ABC transporter permease [Bacteroidales bacterium]
MIHRLLTIIGEYFLFLRQVFSKPEKWRIFFKKLVEEMNAMGIGSLLIVAIVSVSMGSVITIQTAMQIESSWIPTWTVGFVSRTSIVMELCPTIISLLLVGNLGSRITAEIGSMRVTEQIDALEVMGINPASHLVLPKVIASLIVNPVLIIYSICFALVGGYITIILSGSVSPYDFMDGLTYCFRVYDIIYAVTKTFVFAFIMSTVSSFYGYRIEGGALELGKASTQGIMVSSFLILIINVLITQIML